MKKMNKKGFTLIELLAVIVVLAIVMVIATQKITDVVNSSRSNAFILSYKSVVKQVKDSYTMGDSPICPQTKNGKEITCSEMYDVTDGDYELTVKDSGNDFEVILKTKKGGKFEHLNLAQYGDASNSGKCDKSKIGSGANICGNIQEMVNGKLLDYNGIKGYVAK